MSKDTLTTYGPKGKILTVNTTARLRTDARINWITIYNTGAITVNVAFEEATLSPLPIPASTSLELDVWRMLTLNVQTIDFSSASSTMVNLIWAEGPSPLVLFGRGK